jgi:hypothetical protein
MTKEIKHNRFDAFYHLYKSNVPVESQFIILVFSLIGMLLICTIIFNYIAGLIT